MILPADETTDRESPDYQNRQSLLAMFHALRPSAEGVACTPLSELRVSLGRQTIATRAQVGGRTDDDELRVECRAARSGPHPRVARRPAGRG